MFDSRRPSLAVRRAAIVIYRESGGVVVIDRVCCCGDEVCYWPCMLLGGFVMGWLEQYNECARRRLLAPDATVTHRVVQQRVLALPRRTPMLNIHHIISRCGFFSPGARALAVTKGMAKQYAMMAVAGLVVLGESLLLRLHRLPRFGEFVGRPLVAGFGRASARRARACPACAYCARAYRARATPVFGGVTQMIAGGAE